MEERITKFIYPYGDCSCPKFIYEQDLDNIAPDDSLVYWDYEGCGADFHTCPNFGCIHWVHK
jgi:hypothetical protein